MKAGLDGRSPTLDWITVMFKQAVWGCGKDLNSMSSLLVLW